MKHKNIHKALMCSALIVSSPSFALTNPSDINTATAEGVASILSQQIADASIESDPSKTPVSPKSGTATESPADIAQKDKEEALKDCTYPETAKTIIEERVKAAISQPNVDAIFNPVEDIVKGCLAGSATAAGSIMSSGVINLADYVPQVNTSAIGTATQTALKKILTAKLTQIQKQVCEVADKAVLEAILPVQKHIVEFKNKMSGITVAGGGIVGGGFGGGQATQSEYEQMGVLLGSIAGSSIELMNNKGEANAVEQNKTQVIVDQAISAAQQVYQQALQSVVNGNQATGTSGTSPYVSPTTGGTGGSVQGSTSTTNQTSGSTALRYTPPPTTSTSTARTTTNTSVDTSSTTTPSSNANPYLSGTDSSAKTSPF